MDGAGQTPTITLRSVVTARWVLIGLLATLAVTQWLAPDVVAQWLRWSTDDVRPVLAVLLVWTALNIATRLWLSTHDRVGASAVGLQLVADAVMLTVALGLWGGTTNPFAALFLVPVILATQISATWTWALVAATAAGSGVLFVWRPLPTSADDAYVGHLHGAWIALVASSAIGAWMVQRVTRSTTRERNELTRLRDENIADQHLAALGTLAAGAAHELGTPLGTVNLLAAELPHMEPEEQRSAIDTIKREVERCKDILHRMASPEVRVSALSARDAQPWFLCELQDELDEPDGVKLTFVATAATRETQGTTTLARASLGQIIRELVANGAEACRKKPASRGVTVRIDVVGMEALVEVDDDGVGMEPHIAAAVFDPFFTTKPEGQGMGLGLYLARAQLRQLGGTLELQSSPGRGTKVTLRVALH